MPDAPARPKRGRPRKIAGATLGPDLRLLRSGLHEQAAARLRAMIVRGELAPGAPLIEVELSVALGISRTPLREALKLLAHEGLVELRTHRSPWVRALRPAEIEELFEALAGVERLAAELAAVRMAGADLQRLHDLQDEIEHHHDHGRRDAYYATNRAIHCLIVEAACNTPLAECHAGLLARSEQVRFLALSQGGRWEQSIAEHRQILAALAARDPDRAGRLLGLHVGHTAASVRSGLSDLTEAKSNAA